MSQPLHSNRAGSNIARAAAELDPMTSGLPL